MTEFLSDGQGEKMLDDAIRDGKTLQNVDSRERKFDEWAENKFGEFMENQRTKDKIFTTVEIR